MQRQKKLTYLLKKIFPKISIIYMHFKIKENHIRLYMKIFRRNRVFVSN